MPVGGQPIRPGDKATPWRWQPAQSQYARLHLARAQAPASDEPAGD